MSIYLKIKNKHLAEEAKIIKFEEKKQAKYGNYSTVNSLCDHRKHVVRTENRATSLARAYIAGRAYNSVERSRKPEKDYEFVYNVLPRVLSMIQKYHNRRLDKSDVYNWVYSK